MCVVCQCIARVTSACSVARASAHEDMIYGPAITLAKALPLLVRCCQGGRPVRIPDPPPRPLQTPPKLFEPVFLQFGILGKGSVPKAPKFSFPPLPEGVFLLPYVSILEKLRILWRFQKCLKDTENLLTPGLTSWSDLG